MKDIGPVVYRNISELKPYKNNARTHSKKQVKQIATSIEQFGFVNPALVDDDDNLIAGHGRVAAAKEIGLQTVPTIKITHLTPEQIKAYRLADNKLAELAGWDDDILKIEFQHLQEFADVLDLTVTGFEVAEIDILLGNSEKVEEADAPFDDLIKPDPVSRPGDLWLLGDHKILCGSALEVKDYAGLMGDEQAQMIFTDPPYNVRVKDISGLGKHKHAEFAMASGEMDRAEFLAFLGTALGHMVDHSADGSIHFVCMDWRHIEELVAAGREVYSELKNICVWAKDNGGMGSLYRSQHEFVAVFKNGTAPHVNNIQLGKHGRYRTNLWKYAGQNTFHAGR
ncbi:MAG TPA: site-specific DNA-methyltransferase, partial [Alphaproteobacteria bacterium]|nr:site-specific DNA-methyltransferase [Alphaproteobacteria bacterium]